MAVTFPPTSSLSVMPECCSTRNWYNSSQVVGVDLGDVDSSPPVSEKTHWLELESLAEHQAKMHCCTLMKLKQALIFLSDIHLL